MVQGMTSPAYDTIITLGHLITAEGCLTPQLEARLKRSIGLYERGVSQTLTMSGGRSDKEPTSAARAMCHYAVRAGIPEARVLLEENALDTIGEAVFTRMQIVAPHGMRRLLVVTSGYHAARAREIFRWVYGRACALEWEGVEGGYEDTLELHARERRSWQECTALFGGVAVGDLHGILERFWGAHPLYQGSEFRVMRESMLRVL